MTTQNITTYTDCVASLRTSLNFLESSVDTLGNGVSDFPRLSNILKSIRVCLPVPLPPSLPPYAPPSLLSLYIPCLAPNTHTSKSPAKTNPTN